MKKKEYINEQKKKVSTRGSKCNVQERRLSRYIYGRRQLNKDIQSDPSGRNLQRTKVAMAKADLTRVDRRPQQVMRCTFEWLSHS